ncbi:flagellar basal-body rod protein FlgB [Lachnospiraceae bacterium KM106-2]|nr:flagellar basal-body rod protein FlgB [Lachnospiraceae bacterium KM106-2]
MINSSAYNYINVLERTSDVSWKRNSLISNNIANVDTPNYKRKDVSFNSYLTSALSGGSSLDEGVNNLDLSKVTGNVYTDHATLSYRTDGNNVDIDTETSNLAQNQVKYYTMLDSITQEFSRLKTVLNSK